MITIEPLTHAVLAETIQLACSIFPHDDPQKIAKILTNVLAPESLEQRLAEHGYASGESWVAIENKTVIGFTGYYVLQRDIHEAIWLNWYGVAPGARGKQLGLKLLEMIITEAKRLNKKYLRLFTSSEYDEEKRAQEIYKKRGFVEFDGRGFYTSLPPNILYLQLDLRS